VAECQKKKKTGQPELKKNKKRGQPGGKKGTKEKEKRRKKGDSLNCPIFWKKGRKKGEKRGQPELSYFLSACRLEAGEIPREPSSPPYHQ